MTSFRIRVLTFITLVFAAVPALAQEETAATAAINPAASLGCLAVGIVALGAVGFLSHARESQGEQDPTVQPIAADAGKTGQ